MVERFKLVTLGFAILLATVFLIWIRGMWEWMDILLLLSAISIIVWTLFVRQRKLFKVSEFSLNSLVVSYVVTGVIWFIQLSITTPSFYAQLNLVSLMNQLALRVLPLSLLPVAVSVIIYGILRTRLKAWEMFLPSWYVSVIIVFAIYPAWWSFYARPSLSEFYISSGGLVFLSLITAAVLTVAYVVFKKRTINEPKIM